jgi:haloalkane dehalogenase
MGTFPRFDVNLAGYRVHYVDAGDGPPVVLVHGSPLSSYAFRHQIAALSPHFRIVAPDLLGFGRSEAPEEGTSFLEQSEVLRCLLEHLALGPFRLLVHDWGGPIGLGAVADRIEQVHQLVLVNTTVRRDLKPPPYWRAFTGRPLGDWLVVRLKVFQRGLPLMMRAARDPAVRTQYARSLEQEGTRRTMLALERLEGYEALMARVERIVPVLRVPTLIVWGHPDAYFGRDELRHLVRAFPEATVHEIAGGGHFPMEDAPEEMNQTLLGFLT